LLEDRLKRLGLRVSRKNVKQSTLSGKTTKEDRLSAYSGDGRIKIIYSEYTDGNRRLSILLTGSMATKEKEEIATKLGGSVDFDEKERLYAVFKPESEKKAEEIVNEMLGNTDA
jgi:hypothetical protein